MKIVFRGKPVVFALSSILVPAICWSESADGEDVSLPDLNNAAHYLAGMTPPHPKAASAKYFESSAWRTHQRLMQKEWTRYEESRLAPMSAWAAAETVPFTKKGGVVRYMFSGPDILHARRMFPEASTYVMCGLEQPGGPPDLNRLSGYSAEYALSQIRKALEDSLRLSFFITKDMQRELHQARFSGVFPIVSLYLARSNLPVRSYEYLKLKKDGTLVSLGASGKGATGFRIEAGPSASEKVEVFYFRVDLGNDGIAKSGFLEFLETLPPGGAYLKAASYIPHSSYFSKITDHLLENTSVLVQDDSGVPLRKFDKDGWKLTHYGAYTRPISLFSGKYQSDLRKAYLANGVKPLKFGTGYKWRRNESNLMLAVRKDAAFASAESQKPVAIAAVEAMPPKKVDPEVGRDPKPKTASGTPPGVADKTASAGKGPGSPNSTGKPSRAAGPVTVTATLRKGPPMAEAAKLSGNVLGIFDYEVLSVDRGNYSADKIRIAHGVIWGGRRTGAASRKPGATLSMNLVPLSTYPRLAGLPKLGSAAGQDDLIFIPALD